MINAKQLFYNLLAKKIATKAVVLESDDWGTIRTSSREAHQALLKKGYPVNKCAYNTNDALEGNKDLELLFDVLNSVRGCDGRPAILTANNIVSNPDFRKIQNENYLEYYFEPFTKTLQRYPEHDKVLDIYMQGINNNVVMPQFHGREHVHVKHWLDGLTQKEPKAIDTFLYEMFSVFLGNESTCNKEYLNAMAFFNPNEEKFIKNSVEEGLNLFEKIWGFKSKTVIAPCYSWHRRLEKTLHNGGVKIIQGGRAQIEPIDGTQMHKVVRHYNGWKNEYGQIYTTRNVSFEPSTNPTKDWVDTALKEISNAFYWKQPAIISSHRLNYIGWLNPINRETNLRLLKNLLKQIKTKWPDVIFISSDQMTKYYN